MNAQKQVLIDDIERIVLFDDSIGLKTPKSTNGKKTIPSTTKNNHANTALIIALLGLLVLIALFIYKNMQDNE